MTERACTVALELLAGAGRSWASLARWVHHYNWHRPHQGIRGATPISRLGSSGNNLLTLHTAAVRHSAAANALDE